MANTAVATLLSPLAQQQYALYRLQQAAARTQGDQYAAYQRDPLGFGREQLGHRYAPGIEQVMESVRDYPITIAESCNAYGKTHGAADIAIWFFKAFADAQVYTTAAPPERNLKLLLWGEISERTERRPALFVGDALHVLMIARSSRSFVAGVTIPSSGTPAQREARFSGKNAPHLLFIVDEGDAVPAEVYKGIESCMSGGHARLLIMYNPRSDEGPIAQMKARGANVVRLSAFDHPNVVMGEDGLFPGAVTRGKVLNRIYKWTAPAAMEGVQGYGRFSVPDFLVGQTAVDDETGGVLPPLPGGERVITTPEFSYMVLGVYPGASAGIVYDVWLDDYDRATAEGREPVGNVTRAAEFVPSGGAVYWAMDDGYAGSIDPQTGMFTKDSHPRVIGLYQVRADGRVCRFDEVYQIRQPRAEEQIQTGCDLGYPEPAFVVVGPGSAALGGLLGQLGFYKRTCSANVEESVKKLREWIAADEHGQRRFLVHPRCRHFRYEVARYRRDDAGRIIKAYDHGPDEARYLAWVGRNGF